jgi:hypothetical protein
MKLRKTVLVVGLMVLFCLLTAAPQVFAAGGPEPPANAIIQNGELWGAVVVYCSPGTQDFAVVRVKRVVNCNVETQTLVDPAWSFGCSDDPTAPVHWDLPAGTTFFDITGTPFIAKVKNYHKNVQTGGDVYSFDAQFKFWIPGP